MIVVDEAPLEPQAALRRHDVMAGHHRARSLPPEAWAGIAERLRQAAEVVPLAFVIKYVRRYNDAVARWRRAMMIREQASNQPRPNE